MSAATVTFDFSANPFDAVGASDRQRYETMLAIAGLGYELGFRTVWLAEHNFTDYYITPSPLVAYANIAGRYPGLGLGTCVIVVPWYEPVRLASEIAMVTNLTDAHLHLVMGRGNTPLEYKGYGRDMSKSLVLFKETMDIIRLALTGEPFTYRGQELSVETEIRIRPRPRAQQVTFYGGCSNPRSAEKVARMGLGMLGSSWHSLEAGRYMTELWDRAARESGTDPGIDKVIWVQTLMAPSDDEAMALGEKHIREFYKLVCRHYDLREDWLAEERDYAEAGKYFADLVMGLAFTDKLTEHLTRQFVGSPKTVAERVQAFIDCGFTRIIVQPDLHSIPREMQARSLRLFAEKVAPHFTTALEAHRRAAE